MKSIWLFLFVTLCLGCISSINSKQELRAYIDDPSNGLKQAKMLRNEIEVVMVYIPPQLLGQRWIKDSSKQSYFSLRLSRKNTQVLRQLDMSSYSQLLQTFSFRMLNYAVALDQDNQQIRPIDALYQQTFGLTPYDELLIVFDAQKMLKTKHLKINIDEFGLNLGDLVFDFQTKDILTVNEKLNHQLKM